MHGFYERHNFKIDADEGRDEMMADLEKLHDELFHAWQMASKISDVILNVMIEQKKAHT
ncbi:MAG: hypothetical protein JKY96_02225 [Phycisphaerales bacterium]|nr:hypothetical protein [Phycisphaerales bacterium]